RTASQHGTTHFGASPQISRNNNTRIADHGARVFARVGRGGVFDEVGPGGAQNLGGGQHSHRGPETAHGNVFSLEDVVKTGGIERQDAVNGLAVFHACDAIGFVMVHVA